MPVSFQVVVRPIPWTPVKLCETCETLFAEPLSLSPYKGVSHKPYHTRPTWMESISRRCIMCFPLLAQFLDRDWQSLGEVTNEDDLINIAIRECTEWHDLDPRCLDIGFARASMFRIEARSPSQRAALVTARHFRLVPKELMVKFRSHEVLTRQALIQRWFDVCKQHVRCADKSPSFCPSRLLEVGPTWLRVVEKPPKGVVYLTLSHRWIGREVTLLTENLEKMRSGLPLAQLSGDVAAGIKWTRALGFQYIWIDTLCVLQDSYQDWLTEAQQMADIYRHSWCTLAASDGAQPNVPMGASFQPGIWSEPDDEPVGVVHDIRSSWSYKGVTNWCLVDAGYWRLDWQERELNTRGWVYQEALLSRRVVHFHGEQLLWQCCELTASESFPRGFPPKELVGEAQASIALTGDKSQQRRQAVTRYSTRHLTFGKDKLIAFAGIVAYLQSDDWYHAGLWGHDVVRQLLWSVAGHTQMNGKDVCYCPDAKVPSWSWANVDAMIDYEEHYYSKTDRQLTHHVDMISADPATLELCVRGLLYSHSSDCPLRLLRHHGGFAAENVIIPDVDEGGDEYPFKVPPELRYLYMQSESEAPDGTTSLRCLALLAVPGRQGFFVRFGVARADTAEACAYFDDEKNRCGETAYMPNECGALTIV